MRIIEADMVKLDERADVRQVVCECSDVDVAELNRLLQSGEAVLLDGPLMGWGDRDVTVRHTAEDGSRGYYHAKLDIPGIEAEPKSWKVGCKTRGDSDWAYNGLRFATKEEAEAYGSELFCRWTALEHYEAHPSEDEPNR